MRLKQSLTTGGTLGFAAATGLIGALALGSPAQAEDTTIHLKEQHKNQTADSSQFEQLCGEDEHIPADKPVDYDGWVFNYPGSAQYDTEILVLTAEFTDEDGETHFLDTDDDGFTINDTGTLKAYIGAPAGWTLVDAEAQLSGADHTWKDTFVVTHACPAETPGDDATTPGEEPTDGVSESPTPGDENSTPAGESTEPGEASTSPAGGSTLPTTGTPLTIALVSAAALAAGGVALFMMKRRRAAQDW